MDLVDANMEMKTQLESFNYGHAFIKWKKWDLKSTHTWL